MGAITLKSILNLDFCGMLFNLTIIPEIITFLDPCYEKAVELGGKVGFLEHRVLPKEAVLQVMLGVSNCVKRGIKR